jgi:hypothetical protein
MATLRPRKVTNRRQESVGKIFTEALHNTIAARAFALKRAADPMGRVEQAQRRSKKVQRCHSATAAHDAAKAEVARFASVGD